MKSEEDFEKSVEETVKSESCLKGTTSITSENELLTQKMMQLQEAYSSQM